MPIGFVLPFAYFFEIRIGAAPGTATSERGAYPGKRTAHTAAGLAPTATRV